MNKNRETNFVRFHKLLSIVSVVGSYISMLMGELLNHLKVINIVRLIIVGIFMVNW